jgi:hypothetical protein
MSPLILINERCPITKLALQNINHFWDGIYHQLVRINNATQHCRYATELTARSAFSWKHLGLFVVNLVIETPLTQMRPLSATVLIGDCERKRKVFPCRLTLVISNDHLAPFPTTPLSNLRFYIPIYYK